MKKPISNFFLTFNCFFLTHLSKKATFIVPSRCNLPENDAAYNNWSTSYNMIFGYEQKKNTLYSIQNMEDIKIFVSENKNDFVSRLCISIL